MAEIKDYSTTAGSNNSASPNGMPENMAPSGVNNSWREGIARVKRWYEDISAVNSLAGGTTAYTLAASRTISSYAAGDVFVAVCNATNTGASTLNVDSVGAKNIVAADQTPITAGQLVADGIYTFAYDANNDTFICLNPTVEGMLRNVVLYATTSETVSDWLGQQTTNGKYVVEDSPGVKFIVVHVYGGGGAGGGADATGAGEAAAGAGGGSGGYATLRIAASSLAASPGETVTVGAGGTAASGSTGGNGGTTSFGAHCTATGGTGGGVAAAGSGSTGTNDSTGGAGSSGDINLNGNPGTKGYREGTANVASAIGYSGAGGAGVGPLGGAGGHGRTSGSAVGGIDGKQVGAGGSGAASGQSQSAGTGGNGAEGLVIVEEYY